MATLYRRDIVRIVHAIWRALYLVVLNFRDMGGLLVVRVYGCFPWIEIVDISIEFILNTIFDVFFLNNVNSSLKN